MGLDRKLNKEHSFVSVLVQRNWGTLTIQFKDGEMKFKRF